MLKMTGRSFATLLLLAQRAHAFEIGEALAGANQLPEPARPTAQLLGALR